MKNRQTERGVAVPVVAILALAIFLVIAAVTQLLMRSSRQVHHFDQMNRTFRLAETATNRALGFLSNDPIAFQTFNTAVNTDTQEHGTYSVWAATETFGEANYYLVSTATRNVKGRVYWSQIHTHARVSNVADYFAAVATEFVVSRGIDASNGKIFANILKFGLTDSVDNTLVKQAEYVASVEPSTASANYGMASIIRLTEPSSGGMAHLPVKLNTAIVFPQVLASDLARYRILAATHTFLSVWGGPATGENEEIYPPTYYRDNDTDFDCENNDRYPGDQYGRFGARVESPSIGPICNNEQKVYYSTGPIYIQGRVHGQVLFVSEQSIYITGNLTRAVDGTDELPGWGNLSVNQGSSTAHQPILITRFSVVISSNYYKTADFPGNKTQFIQGLLMAPHGQLQTQAYTDGTWHTHLRLEFEGSIIVGGIPSSSPNNLPTVFQGTFAGPKRQYRYMSSLKDHPPPYLPATAEIIYQVERTGGANDLY